LHTIKKYHLLAEVQDPPVMHFELSDLMELEQIVEIGIAFERQVYRYVIEY
jgi:hypothetical protein